MQHTDIQTIVSNSDQGQQYKSFKMQIKSAFFLLTIQKYKHNLYSQLTITYYMRRNRIAKGMQLRKV